MSQSNSPKTETKTDAKADNKSAEPATKKAAKGNAEAKNVEKAQPTASKDVTKAGKDATAASAKVGDSSHVPTAPTGAKTEVGPIEPAPGGVDQPEFRTAAEREAGEAYREGNAVGKTEDGDVSNLNREAELIKSVEHHHAGRVTGDSTVLDVPETDQLDTKSAAKNKT